MLIFENKSQELALLSLQGFIPTQHDITIANRHLIRLSVGLWLRLVVANHM